MEERPDLKRLVRERHTTLQALFEEWHLSGDVKPKENSEEYNKRQTDFNAGDWAEKLTKIVSLFEGVKWNSILTDIQGMLEMAQIYLADLAEQHRNKKS